MIKCLYADEKRCKTYMSLFKIMGKDKPKDVPKADNYCFEFKGLHMSRPVQVWFTKKELEELGLIFSAVGEGKI